MEKVTEKTAWLRSLRRGESKTGQFERPKDCSVMSTLISRFNSEEGKFVGIKIHASYNRSLCQITITGECP